MIESVSIVHVKIAISFGLDNKKGKVNIKQDLRRRGIAGGRLGFDNKLKTVVTPKQNLYKPLNDLFVSSFVSSFVNQCQAMTQKKQTCSYIGTQGHSQSVRILVHESAAPTDSLFSCDDTSSPLEQGDLQEKNIK